MAAFQEILDVLPGRLQTLDFSDVQELRLRVGQAPAVLDELFGACLSGCTPAGLCDASRRTPRRRVRHRGHKKRRNDGLSDSKLSLHPLCA